MDYIHMKSIVRNLLGMAVLTTLSVFANSTGAYEADKASTSTLWAIGDPAQRVAVDTQRRGEFYGNRIKTFLEENKNAKPGGVVFLGDSLTNRFPLAQAFAGQNVYNRGIGGDRIEGVLERLDCSVIALKPSTIHLLIGGNDVLWPADYTKGNLAPGYERLLNALKETAPQAKVICYTMLPFNKEADRLGTCIQDGQTANAQLKEVCAKHKIELVDIYAKFVNENGNFKPGLSDDGVHITLDGYLIWLDLVVKSPEEKFTVWKNLAPEYAKIAKETANITGTNCFRDNHTLILFRTDDGSTATSTRTNEWGYEVKVEQGKITEVASAGNMSLPKWPDGFVLSGIDEFATWLRFHANIGADVKLSSDGKSVTIKSKGDTTANYRNLRCKLLLKMAKNLTPENEAKYKAIASKLHEEITEKEAAQLQKEIDNLENK